MVPVVLLVAFNALIPLMTVVNYSVQETFGNNLFFWHGVGWFQEVLTSERFHASLFRQLAFTFTILLIEVPLGIAVALCMPRKGPWVSVCLVLMALPLLDPLERGRRDVEHFRPAGYRPAGPLGQRPRHRLQLHPAAGLGLGDHRTSWMSGTGRRWSSC